ncbi:MAG TPA: 23S rRNA (pseudouridine(1915)-N(3))-methyltransferase RlmH [Steroidobacteraceae bacterium]|nr:23S rRNA (pseudouridine(1915)-N(3))-methyltransferase RlmH [Steroidobacteraceae bacterium]
MLLRLIAAGTKLPQWMNDAVGDYAVRLQSNDYKFELIEIPLGKHAGDVARAIASEGERMLAKLPDKSYVVALQITGKPLSTATLARFLQARSHDGRDVVFCIGGPEGLAPEVDARADFRWSLSSLTLPHGLARVVVSEALYRAVSVIKGLPYHRA